MTAPSKSLVEAMHEFRVRVKDNKNAGLPHNFVMMSDSCIHMP